MLRIDFKGGQKKSAYDCMPFYTPRIVYMHKFIKKGISVLSRLKIFFLSIRTTFWKKILKRRSFVKLKIKY